ncbi:hypothetical protein [Pedobacter sp. UYP1]|uniref:hypothetical protein n=1 Tax=Pedobacter sp. UYP1 TaxID=1756396 RepID=UPI00339AA1A9
MFKDFTKANYLTLIGIFISLVAMLFGNNFLERWQKAELFYSSQDVEIQYPKDSFRKISKELQDSSFKFYREVTIMNIKTTSASDLKIFVNTNAKIMNSKASSIEDAFEIKIDGGIMKIKTPRLVKGADVLCQFWFREKPGSLIIKYIDNQGVKEIKHITKRDENNYFVITGGIAIFLLILWIYYSYYLSPLFINFKELKDKNVELQQKFDAASSELDELKPDQSEQEQEDVVDALNKILDAHRKK